MYRFDQDSARCRVLTFKEGLLSAVAHDLQIEVGRFEIEVDDAARAVEGRFDATSLRVVCAMRDGREDPAALSDAQKREIEANVARWVLDSRKHPGIRYVSTSVADDGDGFRVAGELELHGVRRALAVLVRRESDHYVATARVHQPDFGIRPYSAMLGTLKVQADVEVRIEIPLPARAAPGNG